MGYITNIILMMLSISFFFYLGGYPNTFSTLACEVGGSQVSSVIPGGCAGAISLYDKLNILLVLLIPASAAVAFIFPNPYAMFAPMAIFLLGIFTFPIGIFNSVDLPAIVTAFIVIFYGTAYLLAVLAFSRGGGPNP